MLTMWRTLLAQRLGAVNTTVMADTGGLDVDAGTVVYEQNAMYIKVNVHAMLFQCLLLLL